jgi:hypothetical protein
METNITGIKVFFNYGIPQLEESVNNYLRKRRTNISITKRDISFNDVNIPSIRISLCYNNEQVERHGIPEQVKIFSNFIGGNYGSPSIENEVQNFIVSKKGAVDVLFLTHSSKHTTLRVIAVFYLDKK